MDVSNDRFECAKADYQELIAKDFPGFDLDSYEQEKALEVVQAEKAAVGSTNEAKPKKRGRKAKDSTSDSSVKGGFSRGSLAEISKTALGAAKSARQTAGAFALSTAKGAKDAVVSFDASEAALSVKGTVAGAGKTIASIDAGVVVDSIKTAASEAGDAIASIDVGGIATTSARIAKTAVGIQGVQDRGEAKIIKEICEEYYAAAAAITEKKCCKLNYAITDFGEYRLHSLHQTIGRFLEFLKSLKQNNKVKEYEILSGADIDTKTLDQMESVDMAASKALCSTAITGAVSAVAVMGTPALVTGAVGALATASTGTAISTLSGAAATNATLAWLGGGSIAAGGGGVAAGATVLAATAISATAVAAILSTGIIVSAHYSHKLTEAKEYEKEVGLTVANLEKAWIFMDGIGKRTAELREVTEELKWRTSSLLDQLEPLIPDFDFSDFDQIKVFNKSAHLVKTMAELAQTPLLDNEGNLSVESMTISVKVRKIMNTEV
jgi:hypothetical protein